MLMVLRRVVIRLDGDYVTIPIMLVRLLLHTNLLLLTRCLLAWSCHNLWCVQVIAESGFGQLSLDFRQTSLRVYCLKQLRLVRGRTRG